MFTDSWLQEISNTFKEAVPDQREHTHTSSTHWKLLFFVYSTRFKHKGEDLFTILPPALKEGLTHSGPLTNINIYQINGLKYVTLKCLQIEFLESGHLLVEA